MMSRNPRRASASGRDPIAVIGLGCRFPGGANDPASFWSLLRDGVDAIREVPPDRWDLRAYYAPEPGTPGKSYARWGGFVDGVDRFDPAFFGISPREAAFMDPQQRMLLEVAYEALEDAGLPLDRLAGSATGVYVGASTTDYGQIQSSAERKDTIDVHTATGGAMSIIAARLAYCFDLKGPTLTVDTACSSALVAVHLACRSLWEGESAMALAGGVNLLLLPDLFIGFGRLSMLSPEGRCKAFHARADGFVRAEGAGVVVLKPLAHARADGDPVYAVIHGTAVNQDGRTNGITVPGRDAQAAMLETAYRDAGIDPGRVQYVEAHGTGTPVGDPIEAHALGTVLSAGRPPDRPLVIGSVKTNIGHMESGSGIAGLAKAVLTVRHGLIPPNLFADEPNPDIPFDDLRLRVPGALEPWPDADGPRLAGVNSFGFGGTNAHVIVGQAPEVASPAAHASVNGSPSNGASVRPSPLLFTVSAHTEEALRERVEGLRDHLRGRGETSLTDLGFTLARRRTHLPHRLTAVAADASALAEQWSAFLDGETRPLLQSGTAPREAPPGPVFVFSGQGPQWWGMGRELLAREPVFQAVIERCDALLSEFADWSLLEELQRDEATSRMQETAISQPAIFALQVGLAALWASYGIRPTAVVGHSVGEVAAAHVAGALTLEEAVRVIYHRSRTMDRASSKGKMLGVSLPAGEAEALLASFAGRVFVAAVNSPSSVTLSGEDEAVDEVARLLEARDVFFRPLRVEYAFHSAQMDPVRDELLTALDGLSPRETALPFYSTVEGAVCDGRALDGDYWWRNVRHTVRFAPAVEALLGDGHEVFVEVGPHPVLAAYILESAAEADRRVAVVPSLRRKEPEQPQVLASLGALHTHGMAVDWAALFPSGSLVSLPRYPWQHASYWHESERIRASRMDTVVHPLLGRLAETPTPAWQRTLNPSGFPYFRDHQIQGQVVFPAAGYLELALAAAREHVDAPVHVLEEVDLHRAFFLEQSIDAELRTTYDPDAWSFTIHGRHRMGDEAWLHLASGRLRGEDGVVPAAIGLPSRRAEAAETLTKAECYETMRRFGLDYGPAFQGVETVWRGEDFAVGRIELPADVSDDGYLIHPALLDACLHVLFLASSFSRNADEPRVFLPVRFEHLQFFRRPAARRLWCLAEGTSGEKNRLEGNLVLTDDEGVPLLRMRGVRSQEVDAVRTETDEAARTAGWVYGLRWRPAPTPAASTTTPPATVPSADEMQATLRSAARRERRALDTLPLRVRFEEEFAPLFSAYLFEAFRGLGWQPELGVRIQPEALAEQLGVVPSHRPVFERLLGSLADDGYFERRPADWIVARLPEAASSAELWRDLCLRYPVLQPELVLAARCGERLADVLTGKVDALTLLFPDASFDLLGHFYESSPFLAFCYGTCRSALEAVVARKPAGHRLRVLEIGAGTGGLTAHLLPVLPPDQTEYVFTDVSPLFLAKAEERFARFPFVSYRTFDVERDPAGQQLAPHSFDVVVAADVLHATRDLRETLAHVRSLLRPNGLLLLVELDQSPHWVNLVFGMTTGWWRFEDHDLRPSYPLLSRARWRTLLADSGFEAPSAFSETSRPSESHHFLLTAHAGVQADEAAPPPAEAAPPRTWLVFADGGGTGANLAERLRARGDACTVVTAGSAFAGPTDGAAVVRPEAHEDYRRLLEAMDGAGPLAGIVHAWSLDAASAEAAAAPSEAILPALSSLTHLVQAWSEQPRASAPALWIVTAGAQPVHLGDASLSAAQAACVGLGRVLTNEHPAFHCRLVDLPPDPTELDVQVLVDELHASPEEAEDEVALRGSARYVPRVTPLDLDEATRTERVSLRRRAVRLESTADGLLDHLALRRVERRPPGPGEVEIEVRAAALNFRDVMKALGIYPTDGDEPFWLGDECAGVVAAVGDGVDGLSVGDDVFGIAPGSLSNYVATRSELVVRKPDGLRFDEAATLPIAFLTAHYALDHLARLEAGERVLIHSATGGVGSAAVQLALAAGAEVFATAGSPAKRAFLRRLGVPHVMDSRSLAFADKVREHTGGEGVDVVLNALAGPALEKSIDCLSRYGRFVEIGKRDIYGNTRLGLRRFKENLSFHALDLAQWMRDRPEHVRAALEGLRARFEDGTLHPLPYRTFPLTAASEAFRYMAQARHIGKVVLTVPDAAFAAAPAKTEETVAFRPDATYVVTGGLRGFGLATARWLLRRGARHLLLLTRSGRTTEEGRSAAEALEAEGAVVHTPCVDVADADALRRTLDEARAALPPLRGVFHAASVIDDGVLLQMNAERLRRVMQPKADGAWNLDRETRTDPLDHFVLFSSVSAVFGTPGQTNYVAANAYLDALAHARRAMGLPALVVNWGRVRDTGYVARNASVQSYLERMALSGFSSEEGLELLGRFLAHDLTRTAVMNVNWHRTPVRIPDLLSELVGAGAQAETAGRDAGRLRDRILAVPPEERLGALQDYLSEQVARVLGLPAEKVPAGRPLNELGLDSLMTVELKNRIEKGSGTTIPAVALMRGPTIESLAELLLDRITGNEGDAPEPSIPAAAGLDEAAEAKQLLDRLDTLSESEIDALLGGIDEEAPPH